MKKSAFSFKGWNLKDWFMGNGKTIKELLKVGIPLLIGFVSTRNPALIGVITIAGKLALDTIEYFMEAK